MLCVVCFGRSWRAVVGFVCCALDCDERVNFNGDFDVDGQFDGVRSDFCCEN